MEEYQPALPIQQFIERLLRLEPGERARLRRNAGQALTEARTDILGLFYSLLPGNLPVSQEGAYFLVATLYPLTNSTSRGNLGYSLHQARTLKNKKGLDRRVRSLLDADEAQLPFRLRQAVHFLHSNRVSVNWPQLLHDILQWSHPERHVQQRWARSYFIGE